ncbi:MAG: helix-turn-helix domain-containing protein [Pseudomonadota bacterium]
MRADFLLLAIYNKPMLGLEEVCDIMGIDVNTAYVKRSTGTFPIPMSGKPLRADIRDVAEYMDRMRAAAN